MPFSPNIFIASTAALLLTFMFSILLLISFAYTALSSANFPTSVATTPNPLPLSPALAASIAAFNDSRFIFFASLLIKSAIFSTVSVTFAKLVISPIRSSICTFISSRISTASSTVFPPIFIESSV
ncbi:hypothetical protein D3C76_1086620 [compost metagenome]